jgi:predicted dehydrogenase
MTPLRVGVIGVGYLGKFHAEKYARMEDVELVGVADIIAERAEGIGKQFGTEAFTNYRDFIDRVDAVSVVVPTPLHFPIGRDLLEHGVDVLIEKPMAETLEQAEVLIEVGASRGAVIQVGHLERFNPAVVALTKVVDRPLFIESHRLSVFKERGTEVDVVLDLMIHDIDIILSLVKSQLQHIHAVGVPVISSRVDIANARLIFENGCVANVTASRISLKNMRKIRIFQKDAYVSVDYSSHDITVIRRDGQGTDLPIPGMSMERATFEKSDALGAEIRSFIDAVKTRQAPLVSGHDGRNALGVALNIVEQIEASTKRVLAEDRR